MSHKPELITLAEVAAILHVSRHTVWRWRRRGLLPEPVRIVGRQGQLRWERREIEQVGRKR